MAGRGLVAGGSAMVGLGLMLGWSAQVVHAQPAAAPTGTGKAAVQGGYLDWEYAEGDKDAPGLKLGGGAAEPAEGVLRFPVRDGSYDTATGTATVRYTGSAVLFYRGRNVTLTEPVLVVTGTGATLRVGIAGKQADVLELETFGIPPEVAGGQVNWRDMPTALTSEGERALADTADNGTVDVSLILAQQAAEPTAGPTPTVAPRVRAATTSPSTTPSGTTTPSTSTSPSTTPGGCDTASPSPTGTTSPTTTPSGSSSPTTAALGRPLATTSGSTSPSSSTSPSTSASASTSASPCPSPSNTDVPTGDGDGDGDPSPNPTDGPAGGANLPKTGDALFIPLTLAGSAMVTAGGGALLAARRRVDD